MSLQAGFDAAKEGRYQEAIPILEEYCRNCAEQGSAEYCTAQMWLVRGYKATGEIGKALIICQRLMLSEHQKVSDWAGKMYQKLNESPETETENAEPVATKKAVGAAGVKLAMAGVGGNLGLASAVTMSLMSGMVLVLALGIVLIADSENPILGLGIAIAITVLFNAAAFFFSPFLMDLTQYWLYKTRWVELAEIENLSPETIRVIRRVCQQKKIKTPRLGIIEDQNPTAFTYGSLPNSARLVVSRGLFTYLDDDEVATVYAHELGHIVHWDFAVMTVASTLVQICYLIYTTARTIVRSMGDNKVADAAKIASLVAYIFYFIGTYLLLYLSRTREYFADHFAAEVTGNPNGLSRSLVKIAYGIVEEGSRAKEPSRLIEGTRALGIYDAKAAATTGNAYRIASEPGKVGRVFLWDMFNPWGWWMELSSTHPLTGKRVRALSTYAEQLGLETEFDMGKVVGEGKHLNKKKLYGSFFTDILFFGAETIGFFAGILISVILASSTVLNPGLIISCPFICLLFGIIIIALVTYPDYSKAVDTGYKFGSDLKIQDPSGMLYLRYASRFGSLGNFFFGMKRVESLINMDVASVGWFRRGVAPWMDLIKLESNNGTVVNSYHRFGSFLTGGFLIILGIALMVFLAGL